MPMHWPLHWRDFCAIRHAARPWVRPDARAWKPCSIWIETSPRWWNGSKKYWRGKRRAGLRTRQQGSADFHEPARDQALALRCSAFVHARLRVVDRDHIGILAERGVGTIQHHEITVLPGELRFRVLLFVLGFERKADHHPRAFVLAERREHVLGLHEIEAPTLAGFLLLRIDECRLEVAHGGHHEQRIGVLEFTLQR